MLTYYLVHGIPSAFRGGVIVHLYRQAAIGSVSSLSGHAIAYRWRSLARVRRHRASSPPGSSNNGGCLTDFIIMGVTGAVGELENAGKRGPGGEGERMDGLHGRGSSGV